MASRIEYAVSMTPIKSVAASGDAPEVDVISTDINKSIGGSGSVTNNNNNDLTTAGYSGGSASYLTANSTGATVYSGAKDFVLIKHTGLTSAGASTTDSVAITYTVTGSNDTITGTLATLKSGEAMVIPRPSVTNSLVIKVKRGGTTDLKVEYVTVSI
jgi:hypothetical protein